MKRLQEISPIVMAGILMSMILCCSGSIYAQDSGSKFNVPEGVYIDLTRDFYKALRDEGQGGEKLYDNDPSTEYLREISISSRFMVETNLQILKQQERILQMLQSLLNDKKK